MIDFNLQLNKVSSEEYDTFDNTPDNFLPVITNRSSSVCNQYAPTRAFHAVRK